MSAEGPTSRPGGEPLNVMASMEVFMSGLEKSLGKSLQPLENVSKQIGGSKFGKNVKAFGGALKGMAGASVQAWAMEQLMKLIEPFMKLLKLLEIPINVLVALLSVFVNEIFVALLPFFLDFSMMLFDLMPIFKLLGHIVGVVLVFGINNIIGYFLNIIEVWKILKTAWDDSGGKIFGKGGFISLAFKGLLDMMKGLINNLIYTVNRFINRINNTLKTNIGRISYLDRDEEEIISVGEIPLLQRGGFTIGGGLTQLHPNEFVIPLEKAPQFGQDPALLTAMEENNRLMGVLIKQNREEAAWRL